MVNARAIKDATPRRATILCLAILLVLLASCAPQPPVSATEYIPGQGLAANTGTIKIRNVVVVSADDGFGTLVATLVNDGNQDDALVGLTLSGGVATLRPSRMSLPARRTAVLGVQTSQSSDPSVATLTGTNVKAGLTLRISFRFERAAPATMNPLVVEHERAYAEVPLPPGDVPGSRSTSRTKGP